MNCNFKTGNRGEACSRCGWELPIDFDAPPQRNCPSRCIHLGKTEETPLLIQCESCNGRVMIKYPANVCEKFGQCLPTYQPPTISAWEENPLSNEYHLCNGCQHSTAKSLQENF